MSKFKVGDIVVDGVGNLIRIYDVYHKFYSIRFLTTNYLKHMAITHIDRVCTIVENVELVKELYL